MCSGYGSRKVTLRSHPCQRESREATLALLPLCFPFGRGAVGFLFAQLPPATSRGHALRAALWFWSVHLRVAVLTLYGRWRKHAPSAPSGGSATRTHLKVGKKFDTVRAACRPHCCHITSFAPAGRVPHAAFGTRPRALGAMCPPAFGTVRLPAPLPRPQAGAPLPLSGPAFGGPLRRRGFML